MTAYLLVLTLCVPGAWSHCSNGLRVERIPDLPSKEICEQVAADIKNNLFYRGHYCIPQEKK